jgi:polyisoprenoid-binding protein YceI
VGGACRVKKTRSLRPPGQGRSERDQGGIRGNGALLRVERRERRHAPQVGDVVGGAFVWNPARSCVVKTSMLDRWKGLGLRVRIAAIAFVASVILVGSAYGYFAFRTSGAPAPASLGEAPKSSGGSRALDGDWVLAPDDGGFAGYRVREVLGVFPAPNDAVGRTTAVRASLRIAGGRIEAAQVSADLTDLHSDEEGRDPAAQMALATDSFPRGGFRLTEPIDLHSPSVGEQLDVNAHGTLTLHGIRKPVDIPLQVRWNGDSFQMAGGVKIQRKDFELEFPQQNGMRVSDSARVEVELTFVHPGSSGKPPALAGPTTAPAADRKSREPVARGRGRLLVTMLAPDKESMLIYAVNIDGSGLTRLTRPAHASGYWTEDSHAVISPDGRALLYSRQLNSQQNTQPPDVYLARADGTRARRLQDKDGIRARGTSPVFSPDGRRVAWLEGQVDAASIQVMNRDGSGARAATDGTSGDADPTLSPDGSEVAFSSFTEDGNSDIFVVRADGSGRTRLTQGPEYDLTPAWSPDGRQIAFGRDGDIYVMGSDGSDMIQLTEGTARDGAPSWSPDGRKIAFVRSDETGRTFAGPSRIIVMNADGSHERRVRLPRQALWPSWIP